MVRSPHRTHRSPRRPHDVRRFADAAYTDVASIATYLSLLAEAHTLLSEMDLNEIQAGVKSKCITAITNLRIIADVMGGEQ